MIAGSLHAAGAVPCSCRRLQNVCAATFQVPPSRTAYPVVSDSKVDPLLVKEKVTNATSGLTEFTALTVAAMPWAALLFAAASSVAANDAPCCSAAWLCAADAFGSKKVV